MFKKLAFLIFSKNKNSSPILVDISKNDKKPENIRAAESKIEYLKNLSDRKSSLILSLKAKMFISKEIHIVKIVGRSSLIDVGVVVASKKVLVMITKIKLIDENIKADRETIFKQEDFKFFKA